MYVLKGFSLPSASDSSLISFLSYHQQFCTSLEASLLLTSLACSSFSSPCMGPLSSDTDLALKRNHLSVAVVSSRTDESIPWARWTLLDLPALGFPSPLLQPFPASVHNGLQPLPGGQSSPARTLGALLGLRQIIPEAFTSCHHPAIPGYAINIFSHLMATQLHTTSSPPCDTACQQKLPLQKSWQRQKDEEDGKARCPLQGSKTKSTLWPSFSSLPLPQMLARPPPGSHLLQHSGSAVLALQLQATTLTHPNRL